MLHNHQWRYSKKYLKRHRRSMKKETFHCMLKQQASIPNFLQAAFGALSFANCIVCAMHREQYNPLHVGQIMIAASWRIRRCTQGKVGSCVLFDTEVPCGGVRGVFWAFQTITNAPSPCVSCM
jgi:hypothetical protein